MTAGDFWKALKARERTFFSGVPCSLLKDVLTYAEGDAALTYVPAVREDAALGVASGAYLAGRFSGVLMQNSGLGNVVNALTSFNLLYHVPVLLGITWRGYQGKDAPEHLLMGEKMFELLALLGIPAFTLSDTKGEETIHQAIDAMERTQTPSALIIPPAVITA